MNFPILQIEENIRQGIPRQAVVVASFLKAEEVVDIHVVGDNIILQVT